MKHSVTIYTGDLKKISAKKNSLKMSEKAEKELVKLLVARKQLDSILQQFTDALGIVMEAGNINLIERELIKITRTVTGRRYSFDPAKTVKPMFCQKTQYLQPNVKAIDAYIELKGKIPTGIMENERKAKVSIELIENE